LSPTVMIPCNVDERLTISRFSSRKIFAQSL
jgi:hypothetical protein